MKKFFFVFCAAAVLPLAGEDVKAPVTDAMIFKNGVSAVRRTVDPGKQTRFELADTIEPLHGSLWFTGPVKSVVRREGKKPVSGKYELSNITKTFAGQQVTLQIANGLNTFREVSGTIWDPAPEGEKSAVTPESHIVWVKLADGQFLMLQRHAIQNIQVKGQPKPVDLPEKFDTRPVWAFSLAQTAEKPFYIDYLTQGLSWQSAYRMVLGKGGKMQIAMDAEIVNNLADLEKADLYLASGYANFINAGNKSPMSMIQKEAQSSPRPQPLMLNQASGRYHKNMRKAAYAPMADSAVAAASFGESATGETEDISLLHIPDFTLKKGEVCHQVLSRAETTFERLVHWQIPARRNPEVGRVYDSSNPEPMDALRFRNPFEQPITTSPVEIRDGGMVLAQVNIPWVNRGDTAIVDITRALTVTGKVMEYEVPAANTDRAEQLLERLVRNKEGKFVSGVLAGRTYRVTDVQGELRLKNHRQQPARLLIKLDYAGTLVSADANPENKVQDQTSFINANASLVWNIEIPANAEKVLKYRYNVLYR